MTTAGELIKTSLERIGVYGAAEVVPAEEIQRGLKQLNRMLDMLSNQNLTCFAISERSFKLIPGKTQYTIGPDPGADIVGQRPLKLITNDASCYVRDHMGNNYPMRVVTREDWNTLGNRSERTQSNIPNTLFYDPQYPLGIIHIWPWPTEGHSVHFDSMFQFSHFAHTDEDIELPPGYEAMLETNLAVDLWPFFKGTEVSKTVMQAAILAKRTVKLTNIRNNMVRYDGAITNRRGNYNVYTDSYRIA